MWYEDVVWTQLAVNTVTVHRSLYKAGSFFDQLLSASQKQFRDGISPVCTCYVRPVVQLCSECVYSCASDRHNAYQHDQPYIKTEPTYAQYYCLFMYLFCSASPRLVSASNYVIIKGATPNYIKCA
jgi:hypothetical protein